jgi:hypothetical protein
VLTVIWIEFKNSNGTISNASAEAIAQYAHLSGGAPAS